LEHKLRRSGAKETDDILGMILRIRRRGSRARSSARYRLRVQICRFHTRRLLYAADGARGSCAPLMTTRPDPSRAATISVWACSPNSAVAASRNGRAPRIGFPRPSLRPPTRFAVPVSGRRGRKDQPHRDRRGDHRHALRECALHGRGRGRGRPHSRSAVEAELLPDMSELLRICQPAVGHHHPQRAQS
jgi:hypothetical protein